MVVVLLLLCVAMFTLYFRESDSGVVHGAQGVVLRVVAPLQNGTARATKPFRDAWNWTGDLFSAKSENAKLKKELEQLRAGVANELATQDENAQLRAMVALDDAEHLPGERHARDGARRGAFHHGVVLHGDHRRRQRRAASASTTPWSTAPGSWAASPRWSRGPPR